MTLIDSKTCGRGKDSQKTYFMYSHIAQRGILGRLRKWHGGFFVHHALG